MDNFCDVLDDNQGRCTCSSSVEKYDKTEAALKQATLDLQDIATKIKYIGLSKDDILTMLTQTEAEEAMADNTDVSNLKLTLEGIQKMLFDPTSTTTTASGSVNFFDFASFDFADDFDLSIFLEDDTTIRNRRGEALFETAKNRCSTVLTDCRAQGIESSVITNAYDMEIDKQCMVYERSLTDANDQMKLTIRNATNVLQQARLMVAQNKNKYDLKGCVNALDECMTDSFVCGDDYENCLDKTGKYIVNGEIILGSEPNGQDYKDNWKYASGKYAFSGGSIPDMVASLFSANSRDDNLASYLNDRIGVITEDGKFTGMCSSVLNQCHAYTFSAGKFIVGNEVVKEYLIRTLARIKASQDLAMTEYGESCRAEIISCFAKNGASSSQPSQPLTTTINACMNYIKTCGAVIGAEDFRGDLAGYVCPASKPILAKTASTWMCVEDPDAPQLGQSIISGRGISTSEIELTWSAADLATSYALYRGTTMIYTGTLLTHTDTGLPQGTYSYHIEAKGDNNKTTTSNTISVSPLAPPSLTASVLSGTNTRTDTNELSWTTPANANGAISYELFSGTTRIYTGSNQTYPHSPIIADTTYTYKVVATDAGGATSDSNVVSITTSLFDNIGGACYYKEPKRSDIATNGGTYIWNYELLFRTGAPETVKYFCAAATSGGTPGGATSTVDSSCAGSEAVFGEAICAAVGGTLGTTRTTTYPTRPDSSSDSTAVHCWCRATKYEGKSCESQWIYVSSKSSRSGCDSVCSKECAGFMSGYPTARSMIFEP